VRSSSGSSVIPESDTEMSSVPNVIRLFLSGIYKIG
jgi:hypothetical protein